MPKHKLKVSLGEILESRLRGRSYYVDNHLASAPDGLRIANAYALWLLLCQDVGNKWGLGRNVTLANLRRCADQLTSLDLKILFGDLDFLLDRVRGWSPFMGNQSFRAFKAWFDPSKLCPPVRSLIWPVITLWFRTSFCASVLRDINSLLQFLKRLTLRDFDYQEEAALSSFMMLESQMRDWRFDAGTVAELRSIITEWFWDCDPYGFLPSHSNGATADVQRGKGPAAKFRAFVLTEDAKAMSQHIGYDLSPYIPFFSPDQVRFAKRQCVPKSATKKRGIGMEPTEKMFFQHSVSRAMELQFLKKGIPVNLRNQDLSRDLCLKSSGSMDHSTIDLSDASDSVHVDLIRSVTTGCRWLYPALEWCRTANLLTEQDEELVLVKYAGMGNAVTFAVECMIFASIAQLACDHVGCAPSYRVYGDDIIVPAEAYDECIRLLQLLNFKVNTEKSFGPYSSFLEACGMEAYCGFDVTPFRISRRYDSVALRTKTSPAALQGCIDLINRAYAFGYINMRRYLVSDLLRYYPAVPFSVNPETGIYHPDPTNQHLVSRFNENTQTLEFRIQRIRARVTRGPEDILYPMTLEKYSHRELDYEPSFEDERVKAGQTRVACEYAWLDQSIFAQPLPLNLGVAPYGDAYGGFGG